MGLEGTLQEIDSLQRNDIYVLEFVDVPPVLRRCFLGVVRYEAQGTVVA